MEATYFVLRPRINYGWRRLNLKRWALTRATRTGQVDELEVVLAGAVEQQDR